MTPREYWLMTEFFVYLHKSDECKDKDCPHCNFLSERFRLERNTEHILETETGDKE